MKNLDLSKLSHIERNPEDYKKYGTLYLQHGGDMFRLQTLFATGCVYGLPEIPQGGDLSSGCYLTYNEDTDLVMVYHMNGYIQPVFCMGLDGEIKNVAMKTMPVEYIEKVRSYIYDNIME